MRVVNLIFPKESVKGFVICELARNFKSNFSIRGANISSNQEGLMVLGFVGEDIDEALSWLKSSGVIVSEFDKSNQAE